MSFSGGFGGVSTVFCEVSRIFYNNKLFIQGLVLGYNNNNEQYLYTSLWLESRTPSERKTIIYVSRLGDYVGPWN